MSPLSTLCAYASPRIDAPRTMLDRTNTVRQGIQKLDYHTWAMAAETLQLGLGGLCRLCRLEELALALEPAGLGRVRLDPLVLGFDVLVEALASQLAAVAAHPESAPLGRGRIRSVRVDPHSAVSQLLCHATRTLDVGRLDTAGEAVLGVVGEADGVCLVAVFESLDGEDGSERLLLHDAHAAMAVVQHGRTKEEALGELRMRFRVGPRSTAHELGPLLDAQLHVRLHLGQMRRRHQRSRLARRVHAVAHLDALGPLHHARHQSVGDRLFDDQARARRAHLARVQKHRGDHRVDGPVQIAVAKHHVRVLAAQLHRASLHRARARRDDATPRIQTAREGDEVDVRMLGQRRTHARTSRREQLHRPHGCARLDEQLDKVHRRQRRHLARLDDHCVARGERGRHLPADLQQRIVPRRNQHAHAHGHVARRALHRVGDDVRDDALGRIQLVGLLRIEAEDVGHVVDVHAALLERLARVLGLDLGQDLLVALQQLGDARQQRRALGARLVRPVRGAEEIDGRVDGGKRILAARLVDHADGRVVVRIDDGARVARLGVRPLAVDVQRRLGRGCARCRRHAAELRCEGGWVRRVQSR
ncbi:hypothetical protein L1887_59527 [Cichorium endivia]|nr:hypothetical protein L1887_59527 [Cichorium endivia]